MWHIGSPAPHHPTHLTIGIRNNQPVTLPLAGLNLALTGPGAADTARAIITELLAKAHRSLVEVVVCEPDATGLLAVDHHELARLAQALPGLVITADLRAALLYLQTEKIHRGRLMADHDAPDIPAVHTADPGEPLPVIVLIADTTRHPNQALQGVRFSQRDAIGALLLLGPWPHATNGTTCHLTTGGRVSHADLLQPDYLDQALAALDKAFDHDPYSEPLARQLMRQQARLGRTDAVRHTHQLLTRRLNNLDVDPDDQTEQLLRTLLHPRHTSASAVGSADE